jgi:hypothetical protein
MSGLVSILSYQITTNTTSSNLFDYLSIWYNDGSANSGDIYDIGRVAAIRGFNKKKTGQPHLIRSYREVWFKVVKCWRKDQIGEVVTPDFRMHRYVTL